MGLPAQTQQTRKNLRGAIQSRDTIVIALVDAKWTAWIAEVLSEFHGQLTQQQVSDDLITQLTAVAETAQPAAMAR
jgi:hypothetical protein